MFPILAGNSAATGYNLTRSLRFRRSASAYLSRTPATTSGNQIFTMSAWVKRGQLGVAQSFMFAFANTNFADGITFQADDTLEVAFYNGAIWYSLYLKTTQVFRDPSAWYHIVLAIDTTQATSTNRFKLYVNGSQVIAFSYTTYPTQNLTFAANSNCVHTWGVGNYTALSNYTDFYTAELNWVTGQQLTPSSFGSFNATTGVWQPARYTGTYGTNGFYLPFTDNSALTTSSNVGLGKDFSGNGNYWTTNNISITAGVTYDSMTDVPTLTSATAANFAVLNPVDKASGVTTSNANLRATTGTAYDEVRATLAVSTKNYFEVTNSGTPSGSYAFLAGFQITQLGLSAVSAARANEFRIISRSTTDVQSGTTTLFSPTAVGNGEVIQFAIDVAAGKAWIGRASAWYNSTGGTTGDPATGANPTFTFTATEVYAVVGGYSVDVSFNAGQRPFAYTPPTGFVALNTFNLPTSTIVKGNTMMDATLYTGNGGTQSIVNAAGFYPDLTWIKSRSAATNNVWYDSNRGATKQIISNSGGGNETTEATGLTAFNSNGFTVGALAALNTNASTYVAWQFKAGAGTNTTNTAGSITSTVSVNASSGFSIVKLTPPASPTYGTVGHGLGIAPSFVLMAPLQNDYTQWYAYLSGLGATKVIGMSNGTVDTYTIWNNTAPTSSVFSIDSGLFNFISANWVAYCWAEIPGYSAFRVIPNVTTDTFVYLGFRPKFLMYKRGNGAGFWFIRDSSRSSYNVATANLNENGNDAESTGGSIDFVSNGFVAKSSIGIDTMVLAFAENPFKNSLAF